MEVEEGAEGEVESGGNGRLIGRNGRGRAVLAGEARPYGLVDVEEVEGGRPGVRVGSEDEGEAVGASGGEGGEEEGAVLDEETDEGGAARPTLQPEEEGSGGGGGGGGDEVVKEGGVEGGAVAREGEVAAEMTGSVCAAWQDAGRVLHLPPRAGQQGEAEAEGQQGEKAGEEVAGRRHFVGQLSTLWQGRRTAAKRGGCRELRHAGTTLTTVGALCRAHSRAAASAHPRRREGDGRTVVESAMAGTVEAGIGDVSCSLCACMDSAHAAVEASWERL